MNRIFFVGCSLIVLLWAWFKSYNGPFEPIAAPHGLINAEYSRLQTLQKTAPGCSGFSGNCEFPKEGLRLRVTFQGVHWNKPYYVFMSLGGGGTGLQWYRAYYGRRHLQLIDKQGRVLADYAQIIWNSGAYGDLSNLIAFDRTRRIVFVAYGPYGFNGMFDLGYAHAFADLI